jgi:type IV pilus assembly protein PilM
LAGLLEKEEVRFSQASLLLPDSYARVAILTLDELPRRRQDALTILRWKTKKAVPFKVEDAAVDYMVLPGTGPQVDVLAVLTPRSVVEGYERVFSALGIHAGLIQLSSLSLLNLYRPILEREVSNGSEFMVANVSEGFVTFIIFRGQKMVFFRSKPFALGLGDGDGESSLRLIRREIQTSLLYYREKLGGKDLTRAYLRVVGQKPEKVAEVFTSQPEISGVDWIDPRKVVDINGRMAGEQGSRILQRLAPALGATLGANRS